VLMRRLSQRVCFWNLREFTERSEAWQAIRNYACLAGSRGGWRSDGLPDRGQITA
jgi:hypothetical protein